MSRGTTTSRRSLTALLLAGSLALAACGGGSDASSPQPTEPVKRAAVQSTSLGELPTLPVGDDQVDHDAAIKVAWTAVPMSLDPHQVADDSVFPLFYDRLFQLDKDRNLLPAIATGYETSDDKLSVTLTLRDDATFADGTPVDAAAVVASLERGRTLETSVVAGQLAPIKSIEATDDHTVVLHLNHPAASLLFALADPVSSIINPKAIEDGTDLATTIAGSTPWKLVNFEPGHSIVLEKDPAAEYWDPAAFTYQRLEVVVSTEGATNLNGLKTGEFQVVRYFGSPDAAADQLGDDYQIDLIPAFGGSAIWLNANVGGPLEDPAVRKAILQTVDRKAISGSVIPNCRPATQIAYEGEPAFDPDLGDPFPFDAAAADAALTDVDTSFDMLVPMLPGEQALATVLQQSLGQAGISAEQDLKSAAEAVPLIVKTPMSVMPNSSRNDFVLTAQNMYLRVFNAAPEGDKAELERLIAEADALDIGSAERTEALQAINRFVTELATVGLVCTSINPWLSAPNVKNVSEMSRTQASKFDARYWYVEK